MKILVTSWVRFEGTETSIIESELKSVREYLKEKDDCDDEDIDNNYKIFNGQIFEDSDYEYSVRYERIED